MFKTRPLVITAMILAAAICRLIPHPWNFTPVAAMALFGGSHFSNKGAAYGIPLGALLLSDLFIGGYPELPFVYVCFAVIVFMGQWIRNEKDFSSVAFACISSSVLFFFVTNFGTWLMTSYYPKTGSGLAACYMAAIPFFRNTLIGDAFFNLVLFGGFGLATRVFPVLREPRSELSVSVR